MLSPFQFKPTPSLIFGSGTLTRLPDLCSRFGPNLLIVTGSRSFCSGDAWQQLHQALLDKGYLVSAARIDGEPSPTMIDRIAGEFSKTPIDAVVAIGGGSVLDGGKAIAAMLVEQQPVTTFLEGVGSQTPSGKTIPCVAVPTTSGTGSEATSNAVISNVGIEGGFKKSLRHDNYIPDIAIVDPMLSISCPPDLTAACGMDTFSQLVEAYLSSNSSGLSDSLALEGIRAVARSLETSCITTENLGARSDMAYASYLSGIVLSNAGLGVVHGFAGAVGGCIEIPHGHLCGTLMPGVNRATLAKLRESDKNPAALVKYSRLGELFCHEPELTDYQYQDHFIDRLESLATLLGSSSLADFGLRPDHIDKLVRQSSNKNNPIAFTEDEMADILKQCLQ